MKICQRYCVMAPCVTARHLVTFPFRRKPFLGDRKPLCGLVQHGCIPLSQTTFNANQDAEKLEVVLSSGFSETDLNGMPLKELTNLLNCKVGIPLLNRRFNIWEASNIRIQSQEKQAMFVTVGFWELLTNCKHISMGSLYYQCTILQNRCAPPPTDYNNHILVMFSKI